MALYPVIMCGGAGTRLWPASRPSRPKPFLKLTGDRSLFQETVLRVAPLAEGGRLIVVGGQAHARWIREQLAEINVDAQILLEPQARDSGPAMAAAAAWTHRMDPDGINAFVASDHHIPDASAFRAAVTEAAEEAERGRIVTLGVAPTSPASAYGYIKPAGRGLSRVEAFVEKPDAQTAGRYILEGYLWNSGNFIVRAATLIEELRRHAPGMAEATAAALPEAEGETTLGAAFAEAPKLSIDYAVMEKTDLASVLEVHFQWSDLGAWDALAAVEGGGGGRRILQDAEGCVVRAAEGMVVAAVGVRNLAIIAEHDAVLVCDLSQAQNLKGVIEALKGDAPHHLDFPDSAG